MVPDIAKKGHSFNGAFAYYFHDKGADTSERVAWTETRNLMTDDPATAKRVMIATAMQSDELKKSAGVKTSGRKSKAHVYAYALSWHPNEADTLTKADMLAAADDTLKELEAENLQAVIVCHTDQAHPHVHVVLNRVDPADGRMHGFKNDRLKLSDWANRYERERGNIVTPKREEKRKAREQNSDKKSRQEYAQAKRDEAAKRDRSEMSPAAILKDLQDAQRVTHRDQWKELSTTNKTRRGEIYNHHRQRIAAMVAEHKEQMQPVWRDHFQDERKRRKEFDRREGSLLGVMQNAIDATAHQHVSGALDGRGQLSAMFKNLLSSQQRFQALDTRLETNRQNIAAQGKQILDAKIAAVKDDRSADLSVQRETFMANRQSLIDTQTQDRAKMRDAWAQLRQRNSTAQPRRKPVKRDFDKSRQASPKPAKAAPTRSQAVSTPSPQPTPSGEVPRSTAKQTSVPKKTWSAPTTKPAKKGLSGTEPAKKDWSKTGASKTASAPPKDWGKKVDAKSKPVKSPTRSFDRDR